MKRNLFNLLLAASVCLLWGGCNIAYEYDIESATDDNVADESNVTVDTETGIDISMYDEARIFPGLVDTATETHVDATVALDWTKRQVTASTLGMQQVPAAIYSTGLYAGAGELVTIEVPQGVNGLTVQVGVHTDDLTDVSSFLRQPIVYTVKGLFPGVNTVRNPLGGYIWLLRDGNSTGEDSYEVKFSGVYQAPDYVLGETDPTQWATTVQNTTVPWLEIRGKHVSFIVPRTRIVEYIQADSRFASNLEGVLEGWDEAVTDYLYEFKGLVAGSSDDEDRAPDYPERVVLDVQLEGNVFMRSGEQGIMAVNSGSVVNQLLDAETFKSGGASSIFTLLAGNYTVFSYRNPWWSLMGTAVDYLPLYRIGEKYSQEEGVTIGSVLPDEDVKEGFPAALSFAAADSSKLLSSNRDADYSYSFGLLPLVQLGHYGSNAAWDCLVQLNKYFRENMVSLAQNTDGEQTFRFLCDYYEQDFSPFFEHWGLTLKDAERTYAAQYPLLDKKVWEYDPFHPDRTVDDFDGSRYRWRTDRTDWEVAAYDSLYDDNYQPNSSGTDTELYAASKIIDGDKTTAWQSNYSDKTDVPQLPYYIVIDLKESTTANGFYLATGTSGYAIRHLIVQTTDATDIRLNDETVEWRTLEDLQGTSFAFDHRNERFFEFGTPQTLRYLRLVIPDISHTEKTAANKGLERRQSLAEFGTYYYK